MTQSDDVSDGKKTEELPEAALPEAGQSEAGQSEAEETGSEPSVESATELDGDDLSGSRKAIDAPDDSDQIEAEPETGAENSETLSEAEALETDPSETGHPETETTAPETFPAEPVPEEPVASKTAAVAEVLPARRGGFLPMVLGGVIAAGVGFASAQYLMTPPVFDPTGLETEITALQSRIDGNAAQIALPADTSALETRLKAEQDATQALISDQLAAFDSRLTALENRPRAEVVLPEEAQVLYQAELARMRERLDSELAGIARAQEAAAKMVADADQTARRAKIVTAYEQIAAAVSSGAGWEGAYGELKALIGDVPMALGEFAVSGVPSQPALVASFPDAARAALNASNTADTTAGNTGGVSGFLRNQLGMRSLQAREGADADAVLSRTEAALRAGDLDAVFREISALPEPARLALAAWAENARIRLTVLNGLGDLSVTVNK